MSQNKPQIFKSGTVVNGGAAAYRLTKNGAVLMRAGGIEPLNSLVSRYKLLSTGMLKSCEGMVPDNRLLLKVLSKTKWNDK